ncbi:MAG: GAF domain-containing protein [Deltaproteobacteria bacterium]|nr:GAF domain-containing protein [Deltaproteobacteria bacterium]
MNTEDKDKELATLRSELEKARERERDYAQARTAMLYMLEDLHRTSEAVTAGQKTWEATFDAITDPIFLLDHELRIVRANRAYAEAAGRPFKAIIGRPYHTIFPVMDRPFDICLGPAENMTHEPAPDIEVSTNGRIYRLRHYFINSEAANEHKAIHLLQDITETKKAEKRLKQEIEITTDLLYIAEATTRVLDMDRLMGEVVQAVHRIVASDICLSYLYDGSGALQPSQTEGLDRSMLPQFRTTSIDMEMPCVKKAFDAARAAVIDLPSANCEGRRFPFDWAERFSTLLLMPLTGKVGRLGLLIAFYKSPHELSEAQARVVTGVMQQVSISLEEARLYKDSVDRAVELSNKIETIKVMHEIDVSMLSTLDTSAILETVASLIGKLIPCDRTTIATIDRERGGFVYQAGFGIAVQKGVFIPFKDTSATQVLETGTSQFTANLADEAPLAPLEARLLREGFLAHIRLPIIVKGEITAVLSVGTKRKGMFTKEMLATLANLVTQIGVALENARLVADLQELFYSTIKTLSNTIDAKSPWTSGHSERVTAHALDIARALGMDEHRIKTIELAGLLHDIGKLGTYEEILNKPGKLTDDEMRLMRA